MTPAELRTLRHACGLSINEFRKIAISPKTGEPVEDRTVRYWETARFKIPEGIAQTIRDFDMELTNLADELAHEKWGSANGVAEFTAFRNVEDFWKAYPTMKGRPLTCHFEILNRCRLILEHEANHPLDVAVEYLGE